MPPQRLFVLIAGNFFVATSFLSGRRSGKRCLEFNSWHSSWSAITPRRRIASGSVKQMQMTLAVAIYFRAEDRRIVVLAIFHGSRDPAIWRGRS